MLKLNIISFYSHKIKLFFWLLIMCVACQKETTLISSDEQVDEKDTCRWEEETDITDIVGVVNGFFPMNIGKKWIYADTTWENGNRISITYDVIIVKVAKKLDADTLWVIEGFGDFIYKNDTPQKFWKPTGAFSPTDSSIDTCKLLFPKFYRPDSDSVLYNLEPFDDVAEYGLIYQIKDNVQTPAGSFDDCICFYEPRTDSYEKYIFCYGEGLVEKKTYEKIIYWKTGEETIKTTRKVLLQVKD